ncbi:hypothetical protein WMY93_004565 [Mugilogobius chulae]|uniref:Septin-type G domain-containing protein n=1 Tax=Mugilogobius chulae TaxID=88201 RepID=A0AAW0PPC2_9GOBI
MAYSSAKGQLQIKSPVPVQSWSSPSPVLVQSQSSPSPVLENMALEKCLKECKPLSDGSPKSYQLMLKRVNLDGFPDEKSKLRRFTYGKQNPKHPNKTILVVGATGTGKSTLINALVNYVMGVKFETDAWIEMIVDNSDREQSESQTSEISVYEVFGFEGTVVPFSLTVIDTPGYGDTRGIKYDDIVTEKLKDLFCIPNGVTVIDAVGLVIKASENRLDNRMCYIFNSVTSLFGKDMEKNIVVMFTFSDGGEPKNALQAVKDAKIKCAKDKDGVPIHFLFNNRQRESREGKAEKRAARFAFETSQEVQVMKERTRLTACIQNIKERVADVEKEENKIKNHREQVQKCADKVKDDSNFKMTVVENYKEKVEIGWRWFDWYAVTCSRCKENCHNPGCTMALTAALCQVMQGGHCTSCTGKCPDSVHVKQTFIYVTKTRVVEKTLDALKKEYENDLKEGTDLLKCMEEKLKKQQEIKNKLLEEAYDHILKLDEIALNANAVSTVIHYDFLIEKMDKEKDRVKLKKLKEMKDRVDKQNQSGANFVDAMTNAGN